MNKRIKRIREDYRFKLVMSGIYILISIGIVYYLGTSVIRLNTRRQTLKDLTVQKAELEKEKKALEEEVKELNDDDYVVRYARDHYIFSKEGEKVIVMPSDDDEKEK